MITLDGEQVNITTFPDQTKQIWHLPVESFTNPEDAMIQWVYENDSELVLIAQLKDLLDSANRESELFIDYLPYARQDKEVSNDATFGLHSFAKLLNALDFKAIHIMDPHSSVATDLITNSSAHYPLTEVRGAVREDKIDLIVYPDHGAQIKYSPLYPELQSVFAEKERDPATGRILATRVNGDVHGKRVLIVDDICDGGATFIGLAKALYDDGAVWVSLMVTHGLFSKGTDVLFDAKIKKIGYTTNITNSQKFTHNLQKEEK